MESHHSTMSASPLDREVPDLEHDFEEIVDGRKLPVHLDFAFRSCQIRLAVTARQSYISILSVKAWLTSEWGADSAWADRCAPRRLAQRPAAIDPTAWLWISVPERSGGPEALSGCGVATRSTFRSKA